MVSFAIFKQTIFRDFPYHTPSLENHLIPLPRHICTTPSLKQKNGPRLPSLKIAPGCQHTLQALSRISHHLYPYAQLALWENRLDFHFETKNLSFLNRSITHMTSFSVSSRPPHRRPGNIPLLMRLARKHTCEQDPQNCKQKRC